MSTGNNDTTRNSKHVLDALSAYIDNALDTDESDKVRAHIKDCDTCRTDYLELRATRQMLLSMPTIVPPRAFTLTQEMIAPKKEGSFWQRLLTPSMAPRLATGSIVAFALLMLFLVGDFAGTRANQSAAYDVSTKAMPQDGQRSSASGGAVSQSTALMSSAPENQYTAATMSALELTPPSNLNSGGMAAPTMTTSLVTTSSGETTTSIQSNIAATPTAIKSAAEGPNDTANKSPGRTDSPAGYSSQNPTSPTNSLRATSIIEAALILLAVSLGVVALWASKRKI